MGFDRVNFDQHCSPSTQASPRHQDSKVQNCCCYSTALSLLKDGNTSILVSPKDLSFSTLEKPQDKGWELPGSSSSSCRPTCHGGHMFPQPSNTQPPPQLALPMVRVLHSSRRVPVAPAHPWGSLGNNFWAWYQKVSASMNLWTSSQKTLLEDRKSWHCLAPGPAATRNALERTLSHGRRKR